MAGPDALNGGPARAGAVVAVGVIRIKRGAGQVLLDRAALAIIKVELTLGEKLPGRFLGQWSEHEVALAESDELGAGIEFAQERHPFNAADVDEVARSGGSLEPTEEVDRFVRFNGFLLR